jgi:hypothetical protein
MKNVKSFALALVIIAGAFFPALNASSPAKKPEVSQIQSYLSKVNFADYVKTDMKVNITFLVNTHNEIIVVSTSHPELDGLVKSTLNYKKLNMGELEYNVLYTLPVTIKL